MGSNPSSSFYNQNFTTFTDTNGSVVDAPLVNTPNPAPSSFYKASGGVLTALAEADFTIAVSVGGSTLNASEWLGAFTFDFIGEFAANLDGSQANARVPSSGTAVLSLLQNGTQFATLTFTSGQNVGVFSGPQTTFQVGDVLEIIAPSGTDATLAHLAITLVGARIT